MTFILSRRLLLTTQSARRRRTNLRVALQNDDGAFLSLHTFLRHRSLEERGLASWAKERANLAGRRMQPLRLHRRYLLASCAGLPAQGLSDAAIGCKRTPGLPLRLAGPLAPAAWQLSASGILPETQHSGANKKKKKRKGSQVPSEYDGMPRKMRELLQLKVWTFGLDIICAPSLQHLVVTLTCASINRVSPPLGSDSMPYCSGLPGVC